MHMKWVCAGTGPLTTKMLSPGMSVGTVIARETQNSKLKNTTRVAVLSESLALLLLINGLLMSFTAF